MSLRTELAVRTESFMGIGDGQGSKQLKLAPKTLKVRICVPYGLEGYSATELKPTKTPTDILKAL